MTAAVALAAAAVPSSIRAQTGAPAISLLDVPYLPQSEALCGGAAIAMVMRYWGQPGIYAETFADLVDPEAGGIRGGELLRALHERGFEALSFEGNLARIQSALRARMPPIALIEDRPGRFHYVVIVGWRDDRLIVHDPARAPFRLIAADAFVRAWAVSGFWTLLAERRTGAPTGPHVRLPPPETPPATSTGASGVCGSMVEEGIRLAGRGDLSAAGHVLEMAAAECPRDAAPFRELAGVHALRREWSDAAREARRALERDPNDKHSARLLATSLFLEDRDEDALDAWNQVGAPIVDLADIRGLDRTRFAVAAAALDLPPETLLTRRRLTRARQRLDALPSVIGSHVTYEPGEDDRAKVNAAVVEHPLLPAGVIPVTATALRLATDRELALHVASPTGGGELWSASWRWWEERPRAAIGVAAPSPFGGVWSLVAFTERQAYGVPGTVFSERRRGVAVQAGDWVTGTTRLAAGAAFDRWDDGSTASVSGGVERTFAAGAGRLSLDGSILLGTRRTAVMSVAGDWASAKERIGSVWHARAGFSAAGSAAPLALWPGAGTGHGRDLTLRAHPLLHDGVIRGVFGRRLVHAGLEWRYWRGTVFRMLRVAPAVFLDSARAFRTPLFGDGRFHADAGAGLRVAIPGAGVLGIDLGRGLRDRNVALSFSWMR